MKESLYKIPKNIKNDVKYKGFDYGNNLFIRTMSKIIFEEEKREEILKKMEKIMVELINQVKNIKKSFNYSIPKDYTDFN